MLFHSSFFTAADTSHLGRVEKASLSTQTLMELFVEGIENKERICGNAEEPADIDEWTGFVHSEEQPTDEAEKQFNIDWSYLLLVGTVDLQWVPPTVIVLDISDNELGGSLNLTALPQSSQKLDLHSNHFSGEIDLCHLPAEIEVLDLSENKLSGSLNLERLPLSIRELRLNYNRFSGTMCLRKLPRGFVDLSVGGNELSGSVDLTALPVTMNSLRLYKNNFEGKTDFSQLPEILNFLDVSYTNLSGEIVVGNQRAYFSVEHSNVQLIQ